MEVAFDRKLLSFYDEMSSMLEHSLRDGQELGVVTGGDVRLMAWLLMGALKEAMFQIVQRGAEYDEDKLVAGAGCSDIKEAGFSAFVCCVTFAFGRQHASR